MNFSNLGAKWRMLLLGAMLGVVIGGGAFLLPDAQAQQGGGMTLSLTGTDQSFAITTTGGLEPSSFNLAAGEQLSFTDPGPGTYGISLVPPPGFAGSLTCDLPGLVAIADLTLQITISEGDDFFEILDCQYQMFEVAVSVTIVKEVASPLGDAFDFTTTGFDQASFTLDNNDDEAFNDRITFRGLVAGEYSVTEVAVPGYRTEISCPSQGAVTTSIDGNTINFTVAGIESTDITCTYTNTTVVVCATKSVGFVASEFGGFTAEDFPFSMQSDMAPVEPIEVQSCEGTAFQVAPGAQYQLSETISPDDAPSVGFVSGDCRVSDFDPVPVIDGVITMAAPTDGSDVTCSFNNESISICVDKALGSGAQQAGIDADGIRFQLNNGDPVATGDFCSEAGPSTRFLVAAGSTATINEIIPEGSPAQPTSITCFQNQIEGAPLAIGTANVAGGSIAIETSTMNTGRIACTFTNDAMVVCVTKLLGSAANNIANPADFTIDLLVAGEDPIALVPNSSDPMCGETEGSGMGIVGAALPPGTAFSLVERDPGTAIGLTSASCVVDNEDVEADLATRTIADVSPRAGLARVDCEFRNDSVVVCVTKRFGKAVNESALDELPGSFAVTVDGESVLSAITPFVGGEVDLCADGSQLRFGFNAAPGSEITLTETAPDASPLRLVRARCGVEAEGSVDLGATLDGQTVSFELSSLDQVDCFVTNDVVIVCVTKLVSEDVAFGLGLSASDFGFTVTADGATMPVIDNVCSDDNTGVDRAVTGYAVTPGSTVTVTENISASPAGLVEASCTVGESVTSGDLASRSVAVTLVGTDRVDCQFSNSVVVVCVAKTLGTNALAAGFAPTDFGFDIQVVDGTASPLSDPPCVQRRVEEDDDEVISSAVFGFAVTPNAGFTITETSSVSASAPIALVNVSCAIEGITPTVDLDAGTVTLPSDLNRDSVSCLFKNDTALVCVGKSLDTSVVDAGYGLGNFSFQLQVDGQPAGDPVVPSAESDISSCSTDAVGADGVAALLAKPGTNYAVTELIADGVRADVTQATCGSLGNDFEPVALDGRTVTFTMALPSATVAPFSHGCDFDNVSIPITINKTVLNDNAGALTVADFVFDVFDADGELIATVSDPDPGSAGAVVFVAPGATFTITERSTPGYETTSAVCAAAGADQALAGTSVTYELSDQERGVECTFVNDDVAPIPVCAMLILEEGATAFTLADFSLELFEEGAIIGQRTADEALDAVCEDQVDNTASLLPGSLVRLGDVFADGSSFGFVAAVADPDELLEFEPSSCTVDSPAALQALTGPDAVTFTADPGATRVICIARAAAKPPVVQTRQSVPSRPIAAFEEPVVATTPATAPLAVPATQVISSAIAVTGTSTTGVTMPVGLSLLAVGFAGLGLGRMRRRRLGDC